MTSNSITQQQEKVVNALADFITANGLHVGDQLPAIREISSHIGFGHVTVAKAIRYLAAKGAVSTKQRQGTILRQHFGKIQKSPATKRIIFVHSINYSNSGLFAPAEELLQILNEFEQKTNDIEFLTLWLSTNEKKHNLHEIVTRYYSPCREKNLRDTIFVLLGSPKWVKEYFQENNIPAIVLGGREEGINLPNITIKTTSVVTEVLNILQICNAFPAVFLYDTVSIGEQKTIYDSFVKFEQDNPDLFHSMRFDDSPAVIKGKLLQLLSGSNRPKSLLVQTDMMGCRILRACHDIGISIPRQLQILSLHSTCFGEQLYPSLSGIFRDPKTVAMHLFEMLNDYFEGKGLTEKHVIVRPVVIFRESFEFNKDNTVISQEYKSSAS